MTRTLLVVVSVALFASESRSSLIVETAEIGGDSRNEGASYSFVVFGEKRLILPARTLIKGVVHNEEKTVWAVNYHQTSDYDGVDLVYEDGTDIYTVADLWSQIGDALRGAGLVKTLQFSRLRLEVDRIMRQRLSCKLSAQLADTKEYIDRTFLVDCTVVGHRIEFALVDR